jgi:hypothetical protein
VHGAILLPGRIDDGAVEVMQAVAWCCYQRYQGDVSRNAMLQSSHAAIHSCDATCTYKTNKLMHEVTMHVTVLCIYNTRNKNSLHI